MKTLLFANYQLVFLNCAVLIVFLTLFVSMLFWINRKSSAPLYRYVESLPLGDDN